MSHSMILEDNPHKIFSNPFGLCQGDFWFNLSLVLTIAIIGTSCNPDLKKTTAEEFKTTIQGEAQGTTWNIAYYDIRERNLKPEVDSVLDAIDLSISTYLPNSVIDRWNESDSGGNVDRLFMEVLIESWNAFQASDGAFDPTVKPLVSLWGFGPEKFENPSAVDDAEIERLKRFVGFDTLKFYFKGEKLEISELGGLKKLPDSIFLWKPASEFELDFNAIGQGWSVDKVAEVFRVREIEVFFIEIGGEIVVGKPKPDGELWRFGIDKPESDMENRALQAIIKLRNRALVTSGNYRKFYERDGVRYAHTIDPSTGIPVQHNLLSATVLGSSAAEADAMATAFMVIGKDSTLSLLKEKTYLSNYVYLIYDSAGVNKTFISPQIKRLIENPE